MDLALALHQLLTPEILGAIVVGSLIGIAGGAMPGLSSASTMAILVPFTFSMHLFTAVILLAAVYTGAQFGGSITAIMINAPGTPEAAVMTFDGYAITRRGEAGRALGISVLSGLIGGVISTLIFIALALPLAKFALSFGPVEYFALAVFGLSLIASLASGSMIKGLLSVLVGLFVTIIGLDPITGTPRYTFGLTELYSGISFVPALIGLFAVSEAVILLTQTEPLIDKNPNMPVQEASRLPSRTDVRSVLPSIGLGSLIGTVIGVMPGAGAAIASVIAYNEAKRWSRNPKKFGNGALEGIAAPEAADKATVGGALVPMLTLGIPGSGSSAVLMGALVLHGIAPGPLLFKNNPDLISILFLSLLAANVIVALFGFWGIRYYVRLVQFNPAVTGTLIIGIAVVGAYAYGGDILAVWVTLGFGILGYFMKLLDYPSAPMILGLVLGGMLENSLRQALIISGGGWTTLISHPLGAGLLGVAVLSLVLQMVRAWSHH